MAEEVRRLIIKRASIKRQITSFKKHLEGLDIHALNEHIASGLRIRCSNLDSLQKTYNDIQDELDFHASEDELESNLTEREFILNEIIELQAESSVIMSKFSESQNSLQMNHVINEAPVIRSSASSTNRPEMAVRLPIMQIPTFSGAYDQWLPFRDMFLSVIDQNNELSDVQKLFYLKSSVSGDALNVIHNIQSTSENYSVAWQVLKDRFENNALIIHQHLKAILDIPQVYKESAPVLQKIIDTVQSNLRSLKSLGQPTDSWDTILIFLITSKLDHYSRREWQLKRNQITGDASLNDFFTHLNTRCTILQSLNIDKQISDVRKQSTNNNITHKQAAANDQNHFKYKSNQHNSNKHNSYTYATTQKFCNFCKNHNHAIYHCEQFLKLSVNRRIQEVNELKLCANCLRSNHTLVNCKALYCSICQENHNTLLHKQVAASTAVTQSQDSINAFADSNSEVLLSTACILVTDIQGNKHNCRALLDSGSQSNFMTQSFAKKLNLNLNKEKVNICGINQSCANSLSSVKAIINSHCSNFSACVKCYVLPTITQKLPMTSFNDSLINIPPEITLSDPNFNLSANIDMLIGAELFFELLNPNQINLGKGLPIIQSTRLGWILSGKLKLPFRQKQLTCATSLISAITTEDLLVKFWEIESFNQKDVKYLTEKEQYCEDHFATNFKRNSQGRFIVKTPFIVPLINSLGSTRKIAERRFFALENKLNLNKEVHREYHKFIREYIQLGHMSEIPENEIPTIHYYLPHHAVIKESSSSTKLRVVFDGSCKSSSGISLNEAQVAGPTVQSDLFSILINFRLFKYALCGDIEKMYRQVLIHPDDKKYQQILWRFSSSEKLKTYQLNTVTYGTSSAPYLATKSLVTLAKINELDHPLESKIIETNFYVDDLITGSDDPEELRKLKQNITRILNSAGFKLHKWTTNCQQLGLEHSSNIKEIAEAANMQSKTLGIVWSTNLDMLRCSANIQKHASITKRSILANTASIFDPLGFLTPVTILPKIFLQKLWALKIDWDAPLPSDIIKEWEIYSSEFNILNQIEIPRYVLQPQCHCIEIHGFADSSEKAYGACIYLRSVDSHNQVLSMLLTSKSRVAPLHKVSLPRLELCATLLLAELLDKIMTIINSKINISDTYLWSDSTIALTWIKSHPSKWKTFVANRVANIQRLTKSDDWYHVPTNQNPADYITRGLLPNQLQSCKTWWSGPEFLSLSRENWPRKVIVINDKIPEERVITLHMLVNGVKIENLFPYSSYSKILRIASYCLRFKTKLKGPILPEELEVAERYILKQVQLESFQEDWSYYKKYQSFSVNSKITSFSPFIGTDGLIRVGGRLTNSNYDYSYKHQILLEPKHGITKLLAMHVHSKTLHCGPQALLYALRERFWVLSGRSFTRNIVRNCIVCYKVKPRFITTKMSDLLKERVTASYPFFICGTDLAGPFQAKQIVGRNFKAHKIYACLFVCYATKAIHIEIVTDLTSNCFIDALRRFVSRRGKPKIIYSDNGTNFVGANNELKDIANFFKNKINADCLTQNASSQGIEWRFIPPRSPHFGGLWEAGVKSVKFHLRRVIGTSKLTYENYLTVFTQIEGILNSRPISQLNSHPDDLSPLSPGHFLIGRPITAIMHPDVTNINSNKLSAYEKLQSLIQHFWKRWSQEYINELQQRQKTKKSAETIHEGDVVLLKEENLPPMCWKLGVVVKTWPGKDNSIRVAEVRLANNNTTTRAVAKLCPLPIHQSNN